MSHFLTDLDIRRRTRDTSTDQRGTWQLLAPLVYHSDLIGLVEVPAGFVTDLASVPRIPVAFLLAGDSGQEAAVVHDFLYSAKAVDRKTADAVFYEACCLGEPKWRAYMMWLGVRIGGSGPYHREPNQQQPADVLQQVPALA